MELARTHWAVRFAIADIVRPREPESQELRQQTHPDLDLEFNCLAGRNRQVAVKEFMTHEPDWLRIFAIDDDRLDLSTNRCTDISHTDGVRPNLSAPVVESRGDDLELSPTFPIVTRSVSSVRPNRDQATDPGEEERHDCDRER